jgi:hypothetical protein
MPARVQQFFYDPNQQRWINQDLTGIAPGAPLAETWTGISSFADSYGEHVYYVATDQHVHQLYFDNTSWVDQDLTNSTNGPSAATAAVIGISSFADGYGEHVYYVATDQHVHQHFFNNTSWVDQDLTNSTAGPLPLAPK